MGPGRRHHPPRVGLDDRRARRPILVGVPRLGIERRPIGKERVQGAHHLGRFVQSPQELLGVHARGRLEILPATVDEDERGAPGAEHPGGLGRDDGPEPVTGDDDRIPGGDLRIEHARAFGDGDDVAAQSLEGVGVVLGRGVGQAVSAQVHRDGPGTPAKPAGDGCPDPGRLREAVDQDDAGHRRGDRRVPGRRGTLRRIAPVEEMDPVVRLDGDHEPVGLARRLGRGIGREGLGHAT